ncbi:MAG: hypothetical protein ABGZ23_09620 [Fuerstiella sp.]
MASDELAKPNNVPIPEESVPVHGTYVTSSAIDADEVTNLALSKGLDVFTDQHGLDYVWIPTGGHWECLRLTSRRLLAVLARLVLAAWQKRPTKQTLKKVVENLEFLAFEGEQHLNLRVAAEGDTLFIDRGDPDWTQIIVSKNGWQVSPQDRPRFRRAVHMRAMPDPVPGGDYTALDRFIPCKSRLHRLLILTWMLSTFYPLVATPMLLFTGPKGAAKTAISRRLRGLVDPSVIPVIGEFDAAELFLTFQNHAVPLFENVSGFKRNVAEMFCRAVTGTGIERRKLFTDADSVIYEFQRAIMINGIHSPSQRPDFLDRSIEIRFDQLESYGQLSELDADFEASKPGILGGLLDVLVSALQKLATVNSPTEFRMADFARFGRAVAMAVGLPETDFDKAYRENIDMQSHDMLDDCPTSRVLREFAAKYSADKPWRGTMDELLNDLIKLLKCDSSIHVRVKDLPGSARWLSSEVAGKAKDLFKVGIVVKK